MGLRSVIASLWRAVWGAHGSAREAIYTAFKDNFDGLVVIGADGRVLAASRTATQFLQGKGAPDIAGRQMEEVLPHSIVRTVEHVLEIGRAGQPTPFELATLSAHEAGKDIIVQYVVNLSHTDTEEGQRPIVSLTFWDVTERREREQEIASLGAVDPLTGAMTRGELLRVINDSLLTDRRRSSGLALLIIDLARFRAVNENFGHARGDVVLKQVVGRFRAAGVEIVARLGGDVFALVRHGRVGGEEMDAFCEALIERLVLPYQVDAHQALIGAAIGLTHTDVSGYDPEILISHADMALSAAKTMPGNAAVRFTPQMDERLREKQDLDAALRLAIIRGELSICYQPQVMLETGEVVAVEALVRWNHPKLGVLPPERFIPIAEETGQIIALGRFVLETATREVAGWPMPMRLAINVSPVQIELTDVVAEIAEALAVSGLPAERLDIEIREDLFVSRADHVVDTLRRLRDLGIGIALDDFGTGYSSLGALGRLPVDKIKIDRSFVRSLPGNAESGAIIRAVMTLSETLDKVVIAEGVENADQAWMLRMMGCKVGQGYHFGRPRSAPEIVEELSRNLERRASAAG